MRASNFYLNINQIFSTKTSNNFKKKLFAEFKNRDVKSKNLKHENDI